MTDPNPDQSIDLLREKNMLLEEVLRSAVSRSETPEAIHAVVNSLNEKLDHMQTQLEATKKMYADMVKYRDSEIDKLDTEIARLRGENTMLKDIQRRAYELLSPGYCMGAKTPAKKQT